MSAPIRIVAEGVATRRANAAAKAEAKAEAE